MSIFLRCPYELKKNYNKAQKVKNEKCINLSRYSE
jgi:hypothetical protein